MKSYSSREILKMLAADGWYEIECVGSTISFAIRRSQAR